MTNNDEEPTATPGFQVSRYIPVIENALWELHDAIPEFRQGMNREEEIIGAIMTIILSAKNIANENNIQIPENI